MATSSITYAIRFRWWAQLAHRLCVFAGVAHMPKWLGKAVMRWGIVLIPLRDKDLGHGPQA